MSAIEDPDSSNEPVGPVPPSDELEGWLSDLRTEVSADPSGWIDKTAADEQPADRPVERNPVDQGRRAPDSPAPSSGGRHRAAD